MRASRLWQIAAILLAATMVAAACGDDDDSQGSAPADGEEGAETDMAEVVEVAEGTVLSLPDCPSDWDAESGLTEDGIDLFMSLPESGPVAALAGLDDGMRAWFDQMEPIDGRTVNLRSVDDAYDPARTLSNVEDALETAEPFAFVAMVGTPNNLAIRDLLEDECVPQLFNLTGHPTWGDPANHPWTIGGLMALSTEASLWCTYIQDELGADASVAAMFMDNDFGLSYEDTVNECDVEVVQSVRHDPAAPDVTDEITTMASSNADVALLGTTGAPCPQAMAAIAQSSWDPTVLMSNNCQGIATYFAPIDPAGEGVIVAATAKEAGELDDPAVQEAREVLEAAGLNPDEGAFYTGLIFAHTVEQALRAAAEMEGGLNRVNLMRAVWNADFENPLGIEGGTYRTDGVNDAYLVERAQLVRYVPPGPDEELGRYEAVGDAIDLEGETGAYEGG